MNIDTSLPKQETVENIACPGYYKHLYFFFVFSNCFTTYMMSKFN